MRPGDGSPPVISMNVIGFVDCSKRGEGAAQAVGSAEVGKKGDERKMHMRGICTKHHDMIPVNTYRLGIFPLPFFRFASPGHRYLRQPSRRYYDSS